MKIGIVLKQLGTQYDDDLKYEVIEMLNTVRWTLGELLSKDDVLGLADEQYYNVRIKK